ncbi:MAG: NADH:flavin oxidoreductase [Isosphaeraceae bacterium]|jgi:2,4-dienoyl-CoA reductase-like NADH-dependent reductase (Old Yellow Enzyme family)|nr:MAG: NADH:flavin oxidoreductase [Isosphaeraceae bacterium]
MSRFFKYKSLESLVAAARAAGWDEPIVADPARLLEPTVVGSRTVGNRLCIQPMEGCDGELDGSPGPLTLRRYQRFGAGGAKLIWGEAAAVVPEGRANPRQLVINAHTADALGRLLETCRAAHQDAFGSTDDLLVGIQLTHSGRYSHPRPHLVQHDPLLDRRTIVDRATGQRADASTPLLSDDDLKRLQDHYVAAARIAARLGFDFIDLKQCHRYLLNELLAARTRPGPFGGSFENRTRFAREVFERIGSECPGLIRATRLNLFDGLPFAPGPDGTAHAETAPGAWAATWGTAAHDPMTPDLTEPLAYLGILRGLGVSLVNASLGNPYASPHLLRPFEYPPPDGYETPEHPLEGVRRHLRLTAMVQHAYPDLPIVGSGYSWLQAYALHVGAASVVAGRTTFVGLGRAALAQPDFGCRLIQGLALDPRRVCRTFSYCTALMRSKHNEMGQFPTGCPPFDKETYGPIWDQARRQSPELRLGKTPTPATSSPANPPTHP